MTFNTAERIDQLLEMLDRILDIYQELYNLSLRKNKLLALQDVQAVQKIVDKEEQLIKVLEELEQQRRELLQEFPLPHDSLEQLVAMLPDPVKTKARNLQQSLKKVVGALTSLHRTNAIITENFLTLVKYKASSLSGGGIVPAYGSDANCTRLPGAKGLVDRTI